MKAIDRRDEALLFETAKAVYKALKTRAGGTCLHLRSPMKAKWRDDTDGWRAKIGNLGKGKPELQIWLDHLSGCKDRKFSFCFFSENRADVRRLQKQSAKSLPVCKTISGKDLGDGDFTVLKRRLRQDEFGEAIFEKYWGKYFYFGIYDPSDRMPRGAVNPQLVNRGVEFFEDVALAWSRAQGRDTNRGIYPRIENRRIVKWHVSRERNGFLAGERKRLDNYICRVCGLRFEDVYGKLGECFAEAHHLIPLHRLTGKVRTHICDLATVCSNCHRMLHRMDGKLEDVAKLRRIVRKHSARK